MTYSKVAIFGPGLLGGSIALAVRERGLAGQIAIWGRSEKSLEPARAAGFDPWLHTSPIKTVEDAELVVLCTPIGAMKELAEAMRPGLDPFAVVTDVGSVKTSVVTALEPILADSARWVGSHPMAGSERTGLEAARADLFQGAACIVTPTSGTDPEAQRVAVEFWTALGCRVRCMSPQEHDRLVGQVSHLTHLAVAALATVPEAQARELAGGGFRDSTRIAASAVEMWTEILMNNRQAVEAPLGQLIATLEKARAALAKGDEKVLQELLRQANHVRNSL